MSVAKLAGMSRARRGAWLVFGCLVVCATGTADAQDTDEAAAAQAEQILMIPLRVHVLQSDRLEEVHCSLTDEDIARIVGKVNGIWHQAGIHFGVESLVREPAMNEDAFTAKRDERQGESRLDDFRLVFPDGSRDPELLHVYFIHDFGVNGVYLGQGEAIVKETARLRPVPGGIDEHIPRVMAHELGHALGLPHRQAVTNLLASGTTGTSLNASEIRRARATARARSGVHTQNELPPLIELLERHGYSESARRMRQWLSELPQAELRAESGDS